MLCVPMGPCLRKDRPVRCPAVRYANPPFAARRCSSHSFALGRGGSTWVTLRRSSRHNIACRSRADVRSLRTTPTRLMEALVTDPLDAEPRYRHPAPFALSPEAALSSALVAAAARASGVPVKSIRAWARTGGISSPAPTRPAARVPPLGAPRGCGPSGASSGRAWRVLPDPSRPGLCP